MYAHVDVIQPTTMFGLLKPMKATYHWDDGSIVETKTSQAVQLDTGAVVDVACNSSITPTCLKQLYQVRRAGATAPSGTEAAFRSTITVLPTMETASVSPAISRRFVHSLPEGFPSFMLIPSLRSMPRTWTLKASIPASGRMPWARTSPSTL